MPYGKNTQKKIRFSSKFVSTITVIQSKQTAKITKFTRTILKNHVWKKGRTFDQKGTKMIIACNVVLKYVLEMENKI